MQAPDLVPVIPEIILLVAACLVLLVEPFLKEDKTAVIAIALSGLVASGAVSLALVGQNRVSFGGMLVLSDYAVFFKILFAFAGVLTVLMSPSYLHALKRHLGEFYALLLFAVVGMDLMAASRDLIPFYVSLELMAVSSYLLAAFFRYRATVQRVVAQVLPHRVVRLGDHAVRHQPGVRRHRIYQLQCHRAGAERNQCHLGDRRPHRDRLRGEPVRYRAGLQSVGGALPHVGARRLPRCAHPGGRVLLGRPEGGGLRSDPGLFRNGLPQHRGRLERAVHRSRGSDDDRRQRVRPGADQRQANAGVLVHRPRRLSAGGSGGLGRGTTGSRAHTPARLC